MGIFDQMLSSLVQMDFYQVLFPFLLALAIFYGIFTASHLSDRLGKKPVSLISIILAFFVMLYARQIPGLSQLITMGSGSTLAIGVMVLFAIVVLALFGLKLDEIIKGDKDKKRPWLGLVIVLIVVYAIIVGVWGVNPLSFTGIPWISGADFWAIIMFILIIAIAWHFISDGEDKKEGAGAGGGKL